MSESKKLYLKNKIIIPLIEAQYYTLTQNLKSSKEFRKFNKKLKVFPEFYNDKRIARTAIKIHRLLNGYAMNFIELLIKIKNKLKRNQYDE